MAVGLSWPLVGRAGELGRVAAARAEGRPGVVVHGPAGLGKSRLAREALAEAERDRALTGWVQATRSAAAVPLGAFAAVISAEVRSDDPFELMQLSVRALRERADGRPLVLGVDDAQWLDPTSATLVLHLATTGTAFVVATVRSDEPCPDAIVSLWKDAGAQRFELGLLGGQETGMLMEGIVGGPVERGARQWVSETSRGNALYVRELVLGALRSGALRLVSGLWRLQVRPPVSASLTELVAARMAGLTREEQEALGLLALGEPLHLSEMLALTGSEPLASTEALTSPVAPGNPSAGSGGCVPQQPTTAAQPSAGGSESSRRGQAAAVQHVADDRVARRTSGTGRGRRGWRHDHHHRTPDPARPDRLAHGPSCVDRRAASLAAQLGDDTGRARVHRSADHARPGEPRAVVRDQRHLAAGPDNQDRADDRRRYRTRAVR